MRDDPRKFGVLLTAPPEKPSFQCAVRFASAALSAGHDVYLYLLDESVRGVRHPAVQELRTRGVKLYACAYGAQQRNLPVDDSAAYAGLTIVSDLLGSTDRFISFN